METHYATYNYDTRTFNLRCGLACGGDPDAEGLTLTRQESLVTCGDCVSARPERHSH